MRRAGLRRTLAATAAMILFFLAAAYAGEGPAPAEPQPPVRNEILAPPLALGQHIDVGVGLHILNIDSIDEVTEQFAVDGYLLLVWKDPRLAFTPDPQHPARLYHPGEIWTPRLEMINGAGARQVYDAIAIVRPDGTVNYAERFRALLSARFRLHRFPFDSQLLPIIIHPFLGAGRFITLGLNDHHLWTASEFDAYSSLAQWELEVVEPEVHAATGYDGSAISEVEFQIGVKRKSSFYIWKVIVPLLLMVMLSWAVFWIEAGDLSTQVTVAVTTILTVIAFAFAISATMPRVPYLTYIDAFFLQCYVFVFLAMFELMMVHVTHRSDRRRDLGIRLRGISRIVIPVAFVLSNILIAAHFLG